MTRPDWCPEDVWAAAQDVCCEMSIEYADGSHAPAIARAIIAERDRAKGVANERVAQLHAAIALPINPEAKAAWAGQLVEALLIEQRIANGHQPKQSIDIEGIHTATRSTP